MYTYQKITNVETLQSEIQASAIVTALASVSLLGDVTTIVFKAELSIEDKAILDSLVAANDPTPTPIVDPIVTIEGEITPKTIKNEHCMEPWGCEKGYIGSEQRACTITLSNKSQDGYTFDYVSTLPLEIGNYVFQNNFCTRSWIASFDATTVTFSEERKPLENGTGVYSTGEWIDSEVPSWKPIMELWGLTLTVKYSRENVGKNDFAELSIVDLDDLFKMDVVTQFLFGVDAVDASPYLTYLGFEDNGEYGHWTKYYDETWITNVNGKTIETPDGAPGELMPGLYLRLSIFTSLLDDTETDIYADYCPTSKDA